MNTKDFTRIAMIAAVYTALCFVPGLSMIAFGQVQIRIAEALTLLPLLDKRAIWGVTLGCFLANLIGAMTGLNPTGILDAVIGTSATFMAAVCTWKFRNIKEAGIPLLSCLMPVIFNFFIVGAELAYLYMPQNLLLGTLINGTYVAIGELIAVALGYFLIRALEKTQIFKD
ncbi:MAG: QueT transporter family protein [Solobacterium sp.]|nr:QueT transporter family protein [Solobacterium sp.]